MFIFVEVKAKIFAPLGMNRSTFVDEVDFDSDDVAGPYLTYGGLHKASVDFIKYVITIR